jgi:hypothetical protein
MSTQDVGPIHQRRLSELCADLELSAPARELIRNELKPLEYALILNKRHMHPDAVRVLARLFPKREGVWWACQCARQSVQVLPAKGAIALAATEAWVADPRDETRQPLFQLANTAGMGTPAGAAALAAYASGGSIMPPELPATEPAESLTSEFLVASVLSAGVADPAGDPFARYRLFVEQGVSLCEQALRG